MNINLRMKKEGIENTDEFRSFYISRYSYYKLQRKKFARDTRDYPIGDTILNEWKQKLRQDKLDQIL